MRKVKAPVFNNVFRTPILFLLLSYAVRADTIGDRRIMWKNVLGDQDWQFFEHQAIQPDSPTSKILALDQKALNTLFDNVGNYRFDGENGEAQTQLLVYFDCKVGHRVLEAQLNRQNAHIKLEVSKKLLWLLGTSSTSLKNSNELVGYLRQNTATK